jgi:thiol:disulfide interchange protein
MFYLGAAMVLVLQLAKIIGFFLMARAMILLRRSVGKKYPTRSLLAVGMLAVISSEKWKRRVEPTCHTHVGRFGHRMRLALALYVVPVLIAVVLRMHVMPWQQNRSNCKRSAAARSAVSCSRLNWTGH